MLDRSNRRKFIAKLGAGTAAMAVGVTFEPVQAWHLTDPEVDEGEHRFVVMPYIQAMLPTQATLMCMTSKKALTWIEYGTNDLSEKAYSIQDGLIDANNTLVRIRLKGLSPDTEYKYRLLSKEIVSFEPYKIVYGQQISSDTYTFRTPGTQAPSVRAVVLNDLHDRAGAYANLLELVKGRPYDFMILNGDMFDYQTNEAQMIDHLLKPCGDLLGGQVPFIMSRGNHEPRGKFAREIKKYFDYPEDRYYQAFAQGPVFWIFLDTGEDKADDHPVYAGLVDFDNYRKEQAVWMEGVMQSEAYKKALYKVVVMHIPPFYTKKEAHGVLHNRILFTPLFEKYHVDLVISGHRHSAGIYPPAQLHSYHLIIGGGPQKGTRTVIYVEADKKKLSVDLIKDDGSETSTVVIEADKRRSSLL